LHEPQQFGFQIYDQQSERAVNLEDCSRTQLTDNELLIVCGGKAFIGMQKLFADLKNRALCLIARSNKFAEVHIIQ
jgi:hypothetical protein